MGTHRTGGERDVHPSRTIPAMTPTPRDGHRPAGGLRLERHSRLGQPCGRPRHGDVRPHAHCHRHGPRRSLRGQNHSPRLTPCSLTRTTAPSRRVHLPLVGHSRRGGVALGADAPSVACRQATVATAVASTWSCWLLGGPGPDSPSRADLIGVLPRNDGPLLTLDVLRKGRQVQGACLRTSRRPCLRTATPSLTSLYGWVHAEPLLLLGVEAAEVALLASESASDVAVASAGCVVSADIVDGLAADAFILGVLVLRVGVR